MFFSEAKSISSLFANKVDMNPEEILSSYFESEILTKKDDKCSFNNSEGLEENGKNNLFNSQRRKTLTCNIVCKDTVVFNISSQLLFSISNFGSFVQTSHKSSSHTVIHNFLGVDAHARYTEIMKDQETTLAVLEPFQENDEGTSSDEEELYDDLLIPWCKLIPWDKLGIKNYFDGFEQSLHSSIDDITKAVTSNYFYLKVESFEELQVLLPKTNSFRCFVLKSEDKFKTEFTVEVLTGFNLGRFEITLKSSTSIINQTRFCLVLYVDSVNIFKSGKSSDNPFESQCKVTELGPNDKFYVPLFLQENAQFYLKLKNNKTHGLSYPAFSLQNTEFEDVKVSCRGDGIVEPITVRVHRDFKSTRFIIHPTFYIQNSLGSKIQVKLGHSTHTILSPGGREPVYVDFPFKIDIQVGKSSMNKVMRSGYLSESGTWFSEGIGTLQYMLSAECLEISAKYSIQNDSGLCLLVKDCREKTVLLPSSSLLFTNKFINNTLELTVGSEISEEPMTFTQVEVGLPQCEHKITCYTQEQEFSLLVIIQSTDVSVKKIVICSLWSFHNRTDKDLVLWETENSVKHPLLLKAKCFQPVWPKSQTAVFSLQLLESQEETTTFNIPLEQGSVILQLNHVSGVKLSQKKVLFKNNIIAIDPHPGKDMLLVIENRCSDFIVKIGQTNKSRWHQVAPGTSLTYICDNWSERSRPTCHWSVCGIQESFRIIASPGEIIWGEQTVVYKIMKSLTKSSDSDSSEYNEVQTILTAILYFLFFIILIFYHIFYSRKMIGENWWSK